MSVFRTSKDVFHRFSEQVKPVSVLVLDKWINMDKNAQDRVNMHVSDWEPQWSHDWIYVVVFDGNLGIATPWGYLKPVIIQPLESNQFRVVIHRYMCSATMPQPLHSSFNGYVEGPLGPREMNGVTLEMFKDSLYTRLELLESFESKIALSEKAKQMLEVSDAKQVLLDRLSYFTTQHIVSSTISNQTLRDRWIRMEHKLVAKRLGQNRSSDCTRLIRCKHEVLTKDQLSPYVADGMTEIHPRETTFFKLPLEHAYLAISNRQAILEHGSAYVPMSVVSNIVQTGLQREIKTESSQLGDVFIQSDERIKSISIGFLKRFDKGAPVTNTAGSITLAKLMPLAPVCMVRLYRMGIDKKEPGWLSYDNRKDLMMYLMNCGVSSKEFMKQIEPKIHMRYEKAGPTEFKSIKSLCETYERRIKARTDPQVKSFKRCSKFIGEGTCPYDNPFVQCRSYYQRRVAALTRSKPDSIIFNPFQFSYNLIELSKKHVV